MSERRSAFILAAGLAIAPWSVQAQAVPQAPAYTPPSSAASPPIPGTANHAVTGGHDMQPAIGARPSSSLIRETLAGIDRLLKSDEAIAGRYSKITEPRDLYGKEIGGNPGLAPIVDPTLEK